MATMSDWDAIRTSEERVLTAKWESSFEAEKQETVDALAKWVFDTIAQNLQRSIEYREPEDWFEWCTFITDSGVNRNIPLKPDSFFFTSHLSWIETKIDALMKAVQPLAEAKFEELRRQPGNERLIFTVYPNEENCFSWQKGIVVSYKLKD